MKLYLLQNTNGDKLEIADFPTSLLSSNSGLVNFFRLYATRVFGGREGRDWRICHQQRCLVPMTVNQLVPVEPGSGPGALTGTKEYGQQLMVE